MTIAHETFTLEKIITAAPANVFRAWAETDLKRAWFVDSDGPEWATQAYSLDFRVGGQETGAFELTEGPGAGVHENATTFLDIEPDARIVFAYTMAMNGRRHSASLATVTLEPVEAGCRLTYTEQGAFFGGSDGAAMRKTGWDHLLGALATTLA